MNHCYVLLSPKETRAVVQRSYYCAEICHCNSVESRVWYLPTHTAPVRFTVLPLRGGDWADFQLAGVHLPLMFRFVPWYFFLSFFFIFYVLVSFKVYLFLSTRAFPLHLLYL